MIVSQVPSGTVPITRMPHGARPRSRTRLVLTAVSSINTSRAGSSTPCSRIQRRRARATSGRCRSAACRLFFNGDAVAIEKPKERATAGSNPSLTQLCNSLDQSQIRLFGTNSRKSSPRTLPAAKLLPPRGFGAALPSSRQRCSHLTADATLTSKRSAGLASRRASLNRFDNTFPQVTRIGPRFHASPPEREYTAKSLYPGNLSEIPPNLNPQGPALVSKKIISTRDRHHVKILDRDVFNELADTRFAQGTKKTHGRL